MRHLLLPAALRRAVLTHARGAAAASRLAGQEELPRAQATGVTTALRPGSVFSRVTSAALSSSFRAIARGNFRTAMSSSAGPVEGTVRDKLTEIFSPVHLEASGDSHFWISTRSHCILRRALTTHNHVRGLVFADINLVRIVGRQLPSLSRCLCLDPLEHLNNDAQHCMHCTTHSLFSLTIVLVLVLVSLRARVRGSHR
jgi:hypothetical protein